ncbi:beta-ketoacyl synthase N-terminal-like domain-containing protein, partial [Paenibacillus sp. A3M_27_13]|uniref:beta-ketoacyl synthase N-terminal-like domain-containing protein n=1 Tax=Paenibacillus sp. A3M_27_13 TaxID=2962029 RepID=UPI0020B6A7D5|nr:phosphopantetheine-binding protein [Paenibacillus sp. A3M_27_13]
MTGPDMEMKIQHLLRSTLSELLQVKPEQLDMNFNWEEYGYDPVVWGEWVRRLNESLGLDLSPAVFHEYPNLQALTQYLLQIQGTPSIDVLIASGDVRTDYGEKADNGPHSTEWLAGMLAEAVAGYVQRRLDLDSSSRVHILQIGQLTTAELSLLLQKLLPFNTQIAEFCCTGSSEGHFLRIEPGLDSVCPFLRFRSLERHMPFMDQQLSPGGYDLVIARGKITDLQHVQQMSREAKIVLKKNGVLLWEDSGSLAPDTDDASGAEAFNTESADRIRSLLTGTGFRNIGMAGCSPGPVLLVAESDGVVRMKRKSLSVSPEAVSSDALNYNSNLPSRSEAADPRLVQYGSEEEHTIEHLQDRSRQYLKDLICEALKISPQQIDSAEPFEKFGIDSIMVIELAAALRKVFSNISSTLFFEYPTIDKLADHLLQSQRERFLELHGVGIADSPNGTVGEETVNADPAMSSEHSGNRFWKGLDTPFAKRQSSLPDTSRDVAVIGLAGRYPGADDVHEFWANLLAGKHSISEIPPERWDWKAYYAEEKGKPGAMYTKWGGFIRDIDAFDSLFFHISPAEAERMDPQERLFLEVAYASVEDAGYTPLTLEHSRKIGVFVGVMNGNYPTGSSYWSIANRLSYLFNFQGPSLAIDTACSSSLTAIHLALESLHSGSCECAIVGGVNLIVDPVHYLKLSAMTMLSSGDKCKAFGDEADGFVDGEGVGAIVLKPLAKALSDGDHIYGVIKGSMINAGGKTHGYTVPNPNAQAEVVADALRRAGIHAREVSYIEAHGTGTALGDPIEIAGLVRAFKEDTEDTQFCAVGSVKSNIGHCESAAGIAGLTKVLMQFKYGVIAPTLHSGTANPEISFEQTPFYLQHASAEWKRPMLHINGKLAEIPRIAGISSFGAGGANAHLIIAEPPLLDEKLNRMRSSPLQPALIVLSARQEDRLVIQASQLLRTLREQNWQDDELADVAYTLQTGREAMDERLGMIVSSVEQLENALQAFVQGEQQKGHLHRGQVSRNKEALAVFADSELRDTAEQWIRLGRYGKLLEWWVRGGEVDWSKLYGEATPRRISLPGYPFARERYWTSRRAGSASEAEARHTSVLHPLVQRNTSDLTEQRYSSRWSGEELFLKDHVVQGRKMLPGAAYLEMALQATLLAAGTAGHEAEQGVRLHGVVWLKPFTVEEGTEQELHIALTP